MSPFTDGTAMNPYDGLDEVTARAILQVQLADLAEVEANTLESGSESNDGDIRLAASLLRQNLEAVCTCISDHSMTQSIAKAVVEDGALVSTKAEEEAAARRDRDMAQQLQSGRQPLRTLGAAPALRVDDDALSRLAGLFMSERSGRALMTMPTLMQETIRSNGGTGPQVKRHDCVACGDTKSYFEVFKAPCNDEYCRSCLRELFERSYTDETLFPPRCCKQVIPINGKDVSMFLNKDIRDKYEPRRVEVETTDRTYCCIKTGSAFIPPTTIENKLGPCPECRTRTCSGCKRAAHAGLCAEDQDEAQTLELARAEGWRRCSKCKRLVELTIGCYHIT